MVATVDIPKMMCLAALCAYGAANVAAEPALSEVNWNEFVVKGAQQSAGFIDSYDLDGDGVKEILLSTLQEEGGFLNSVKGALRLMRSTEGRGLAGPWEEEVLIPTSAGLGFINAPHFMDVDQDGIMDIIVHQGFLTTNSGSYFWMKGPDFTEMIPVSPETEADDYFWHETVQIDLDNDGLMDLVSTSANTNVEPAAKRIEWYRNLGDGVFEQHIISEGYGGVFIKMYDVDGDGDKDIVVSQFWGPPAEPSLVWLEKKDAPSATNDWKGNWEVHEIDSTTGLGYHIEFHDIDGDGEDELVYANHNNLNNDLLVDAEGNSIQSGLYWFEIPSNPKSSSQWEKRVISEGFPVNTFDFGNPDSQGSPGIFSIGDIDGNGLPDVILPGDGTQDLFLLQQNADNTFEKSTIATGKMFGMAQITDIDGDGSMEVVCAQHNFIDNAIQVIFGFPDGNLKIYKPEV